MPWMTIAKIALSLLITAVGKIPPDQWAKIGTMLVDFLNKISNNLPAGHPMITTLNSYKAPLSKLAPQKPADRG